MEVKGMTNIKDASRIPRIAKASCSFHPEIIARLEDVVVEMLRNRSPEVNHRDRKDENALHTATA